MKRPSIHRHEVSLAPDSSRVIIRPFIPGDPQRVAAIIGRTLELTEKEVEHALADVCEEFDHRHFDIEKVLRHHYEIIRPHVYTGRRLSDARQQLLGALFSGEYALESAALFNPSIVPHPDQSGVPAGGLRFVLSLRATGEGHISSIEFRSGMIDADGSISLDLVTHFVTPPDVIANPAYRKRAFLTKLHEICRDNGMCKAVFEPLGDQFTLKQLRKSIERVREAEGQPSHVMEQMLERILWLADSIHDGQLVLPYAMSDQASAIVSIPVDELMACME